MRRSGSRAAARTALPRLVAGCLVAAATLTACGGDGDGTGADPTASTSQTGRVPVVLDFVIENSQVAPTVDRVAVDIGDEVTLSVTSDENDTVHVHGVDRQLVLTAGEEGSVEFNIPPGVPRGVYDVEVHNGGLVLFQLRVR